MIDNFAIVLIHLLLALAALRLVMRADLDRDPEPGEEIAPGTEPGQHKGQPVRRQMEVRRA